MSSLWACEVLVLGRVVLVSGVAHIAVVGALVSIARLSLPELLALVSAESGSAK